MNRWPFIVILVFLLTPSLSRADGGDVDVYATSLLSRTAMMLQITTSAKEKQKLASAKKTLAALQARYDFRVITSDELNNLLADFDAKTTNGTLSDSDYTAFLQEAQPTLEVLCNQCQN